MAIIHDIGKSLLPVHVFRKRGALTLSEEKEYQTHCERGSEIIRSIFPNKKFDEWILYHHEQWDGKGFPKRLKGEEIPLESRILALCNHLDHIMKRHSNDETVYQLLQELGGTVLDPSLVKQITVETISYIRLCLPSQEGLMKEEAVSAESESEVKSNIGDSFFLRYTADNQLLGQTNTLPEEKIIELANLSKAQGSSFHEMIVHEGNTLDVYFQPIEEDVVIFVHNITPILEYRKKINKKILEAYQDVIRTLSDNKITLCLTHEELKGYLGDFRDSIEVRNAHDVTTSRHFLEQYLDLINSPKMKMKIQLAINEAATNLIKHATGGEISVYTKNGTLQVLISDTGSGIPLHELPKTVLISGYSSKRSLGKGFSMMSRFASQVFIYTSSSGTSILLEFSPEVFFGVTDITVGV